MVRIEKQPNENHVLGVDYVNELSRLGGAFTITSALVSGRNLTTGVPDNTVLATTTATVDGSVVKARVQAGVSGNNYKITFLTTLNDGSVLEDDIRMDVLEV